MDLRYHGPEGRVKAFVKIVKGAPNAGREIFERNAAILGGPGAGAKLALPL
jgi:hypothetical protein